MSLDVCVPRLPDASSLHLVFSADANDTTDTAHNTISNATDTADTPDGDIVDLVRDETQPNTYHAIVPRRFCSLMLRHCMCVARGLVRIHM